MPLPPETAGAAPIGLRDGFDGFLKLEVNDAPEACVGLPDPTVCSFVPTAYYLGGPILGPGLTVGLPILMVRRNTLDSVIRDAFERVSAGEEAETVDRNNGIVVLRAVDCMGNPAAGVRFTIDRAGVIPFRLPESRIPITVRPPYDEPIYTDALGVAGFANVPPGNIEAKAYVGDSEIPFGTGELGIAPGQISVTVIRPPQLAAGR